MREEIPISTSYNDGSKGSGGLAGDTVKMVAVGMIKVGEKNLYMIVLLIYIKSKDEYGRHINVKPLSVLDFYVHESFQRKGIYKNSNF